MGAHFRNPVLLTLTLYNAARPTPGADDLTYTTVAQFYPPVNDDPPRFAAHFAAQRWLPDVVTGAAVTRAAATNEGRGDNLVSGGPARWLVIHLDPVRRVRVDLWAWQRAYALDAARSLVRRVAGSVEVTPRLAELFAGVETRDARVAARFTRAVSDAVARLRRCGIATVAPGSVARSGACAVWLSPERRDLHVARAVGRAPLASATRRAGGPPEFRVAEPPPSGRPASLIGPSDFRLAMLYWDESVGRWALEGLGPRMEDDDALRESPLVSAIAAGLADRASAHLLCLARHDLEFHADRVDLDAFFFECDRVASALRAGTLLPGAKAVADTVP
jgi:hypothetical protein